VPGVNLRPSRFAAEATALGGSRLGGLHLRTLTIAALALALLFGVTVFLDQLLPVRRLDGIGLLLFGVTIVALFAGLGIALAHWRTHHWHALYPAVILALGLGATSFAIGPAAAWLREQWLRSQLSAIETAFLARGRDAAILSDTAKRSHLPMSAREGCLRVTIEQNPDAPFEARCFVSRHLAYVYAPTSAPDTTVIDSVRRQTMEPFAPGWYRLWR
jgi:hypothetical protein